MRQLAILQRALLILNNTQIHLCHLPFRNSKHSAADLRRTAVLPLIELGAPRHSTLRPHLRRHQVVHVILVCSHLLLLWRSRQRCLDIDELVVDGGWWLLMVRGQVGSAACGHGACHHTGRIVGVQVHILEDACPYLVGIGRRCVLQGLRIF